MALSTCDLLIRGRDGSEHIGPREGRFFGGKQLKKSLFSCNCVLNGWVCHGCCGWWGHKKLSEKVNRVALLECLLKNYDVQLSQDLEGLGYLFE
jgi:hypothetical protein